MIRKCLICDVAEYQSVMVYLNNLEDTGILESVKAGREVLFVNRKLISKLV